jgi:phytanoyl-CoA hydroxylase
MYKVYKNKIPNDLVDKIIEQHERFKRSPVAVFRAQGTTKFERPRLNKFGSQVNSIQNPHLLGYHNGFRTGIEEVIVHSNISNCLSDFTGFDEHVWYQSMFFDHSTGTKLHQDTWYLDTAPRGKLVGVWVALEKISPDAGPFCVYSNTGDNLLSQSDFDFDDIDNDQNFKTQYPEADRFDFTAEKGDILIWDSLTIHGALMPADDGRTRKSLTAHFYPRGMEIQNPPVRRIYSIYNHANPRPTANPLIWKATELNPLVYQTICWFIFLLEKVSFLKRFFMRESDNEKLAQIRRI